MPTPDRASALYNAAGFAYPVRCPRRSRRRLHRRGAGKIRTASGAGAGGGGIPVIVTPGGVIHGIEAIIDKDLAAALLARELAADALLLTDVDAVYRDWGLPGAQPLRRVTPSYLRRYPFAPGSMGPKVEAACRFVEATRAYAGIGLLEAAAAILAGQAGTLIRLESAV